MKSRLLFVFCCLVLTTAQARLGETLGKIKERFGKPALKPQKNAAVWYFEVEDGRLAYTVGFNAKGKSIWERLEPLERAVFATKTAQDFINLQMEPYKGSKTTHIVAPGAAYAFAGRTLACDRQQVVIVDEPNGILVVWTQSGVPSVMAVRPEAMQ